MPQTVDLPGNRTIEFPDGMGPDEINREIVKAFPELAPTPESSSSRVDVPAPGGMFSSEPASNLRTTQAFPAREDRDQGAAEAQRKFEQAQLDRPHTNEDIIQEPGPITLPRLGKPGSFENEASGMIVGLGEWALNKPEEALMALNPLGEAILLGRYGPDILKTIAEDTPKAWNGDEAAQGRLFGLGLTLGTPMAARYGLKATGRAVRETAAQGMREMSVDEIARGTRLDPLVGELIPETARVTKRQRQAPRPASPDIDPSMSGWVSGVFNPSGRDVQAQRKAARPEVPATEPELDRDVTALQKERAKQQFEADQQQNVLDTIKSKNLNTRQKIVEAFPYLTSEQARDLRNQVFPELKPGTTQDAAPGTVAEPSTLAPEPLKVGPQADLPPDAAPAPEPPTAPAEPPKPPEPPKAEIDPKLETTVSLFMGEGLDLDHALKILNGEMTISQALDQVAPHLSDEGRLEAIVDLQEVLDQHKKEAAAPPEPTPTPSAETKPGEGKISKPLWITREMEQGLADLGYTKEQRNLIRVEEAHDILDKQTRAPKPPEPPAPKPTEEATPAKPPTETPKPSNKWLQAEAPDNSEAKEAAKFAQRQIDALEEQRKKTYEAHQELAKEILSTRGWNKGRIKASAKKADVARYHELSREVHSLETQKDAIRRGAAKDQLATDLAMLAKIVNDESKPLLNRLGARVRMFGEKGEAVPMELGDMLRAEAEAEVRKHFPDVRESEMFRLANEVERAAQLQNDVAKEVEFNPAFKVHAARAAELETAIKGPGVPYHQFSPEARARISKYTPFERSPEMYGKPVEKLPGPELDELHKLIKSESERVHKESAETAERSAKELAEEKAKEDKMMVEAQAVANSAGKPGTKGGRPAGDVKDELVNRIKQALAETLGKDKVTLSRREDGTYVAQADSGAISFGEVEETDKGAFKVRTWRVNAAKEAVTLTVDSMADAEFMIKAMAAEGRGNAIIAVPGDGVYKLLRSGKTLMETLRKAMSLDASSATRRGYSESAPSHKQGQTWLQEAEAEARKGEEGDQPAGSAASDLGPDLFDEPQGAAPGAKAPPIPTPAAAAAAVKPVKPLHQIIKEMAKGLGVPIRYGKTPHPRFGGFFAPLQNLIRSNRAQDFLVVSHEVGHKLDAVFGFSKDPAIAAELDVLGDPSLSPGSHSSWTKSKSKAYKLGEGVAEFTRHWMMDPAKAKKLAPKTYAAFEAGLDSNRDYGNTMRTARDDYQTWAGSEAQAKVRAHVVTGNPNKTQMTLRQLTRDLIDDLHILRIVMDDAERLGGKAIRPKDNIYMLARLLRGAYGRADTFVRHGTVDFHTKEVTLGNSFNDILKPISGHTADFVDYIVSLRAMELNRQGKETGIPRDATAAVVKKFENNKLFNDTFEKLKAWQDSLLQYAVDAGLVTRKAAAAMRKLHQDFVPFHRLYEIGAGEEGSQAGGHAGGGLNLGMPGSLRHLGGSPRAIMNPLETMVKNAYVLTTAAEKHWIHTRLARLSKMKGMGEWVSDVGAPKEQVKFELERVRKQLEDLGADLTDVPDESLLSFWRNSRQIPNGNNIIRVVQGDTAKFYQLKTELYNTFHSLDLEDSTALVRMLAKSADLLRAGVTLDPGFALGANPFRDAFSSAVVSEYGLVPFEAMLKGVAALLNKPKLVAEWSAAGGRNAVESAYFNPEALTKFLREKITKEMTPVQRALVQYNPISALKFLTGTLEEATRIGEYETIYKDLIKGGMPEGDARILAAFESRDRQDFAKGGAKTKSLRQIAPFWNAALQGNVRLAQSFKRDFAGTMLRGFTYITLAKLAEQAYNYNDPDYWELPQWRRDLSFNIRYGTDENGHSKFIPLPVPFEAGIIFATLPGRLIQMYKEGGDLHALKGLQNTIGGALLPNPLPPAVMASLELMSGYDFFRERGMIPQTVADYAPDMQFTDQQSLTARHLGELMGVSPIKVDHFISRMTGGLGKQVTHQGVDRVISAVTGEQRTAQNTAPWGRFFTAPAGIQSQSVQDFYDLRTKLHGEKHRWEIKGEGKDWVGLTEGFDKAATAMAELRKAARSADSDKERQAYALEIMNIAQAMNQAAKESGLR